MAFRGQGEAAVRSHPTVGVAFVGANVSERLSSLREDLPVSMISLLV